MKPKHLHFLAYLEQLFIDGRTIFFAIVGIIAFFHLTWWHFFILFFGWLTFETLDFWKRRYWLTEHELVLTSGILRRKWRHLPYQKIQNIHRSQWFFLKPFALEKIAVDSGGQGGERSNQINLPVIPIWVTWVLQQKHQDPGIALSPLLEVVSEKRAAKSSDFDQGLAQKNGDKTLRTKRVEDDADERYETSIKDLFFYALTAPEVLLQFAIVFGFLGHLDDQFHFFRRLSDEVLAQSLLIIGAAFVAFFFILFVFNIIKTIVLYYGFSLTKRDGHLKIQRGLFEVRQLTFAEARIQSVQVEQNIWRYLLGLATIRLRLITDKSGDDEVDRKLPTLLPLIRVKRATRILHRFLPGLVPEENVTIKPDSLYPAWAMARNAVCWLVVISGIGLSFWLKTYTVVIAIFLIVIGGFAGFFKGSVTGATIVKEGEVLVLQSARLFTKKTVYLRWANIQSMTVSQSVWMAFFKKRAHLEVVVRTDDASTEIKTRYLPLPEAKAVYAAYQKAYQK